MGEKGRVWVERVNDRSSMAEATARVFEAALAERQKS
jgi:hypothetical protein